MDKSEESTEKQKSKEQQEKEKNVDEIIERMVEMIRKGGGKFETFCPLPSGRLIRKFLY